MFKFASSSMLTVALLLIEHTEHFVSLFTVGVLLDIDVAELTTRTRHAVRIVLAYSFV